MAFLDFNGLSHFLDKIKDIFLSTSLKGSANGLAELDENGKIPSTQLPSYVDDVLEYSSLSAFPATGETGKIYVATDTNKTYRWSGSAYIEISPSLALGTTSSTAYRGDRGNSAYKHAVTNKGAAFSSGLYKITTNSEGHVTAAVAVEKSDITDLDIPGQDTTYESKSAVSGGTEVSLVTTGEKYTWNNKSSLTLGTTSSTAYRGDYGNSAYTHAVTNKGSAFASGLYKITTNGEGHVTAASTVVKADITGLGIPAQDTTYESKSASSGGTAVSLVTTGEKYTWNNKSDLTLGTTSSTAYRGDYGASAYAHAVTNKGSAFSSGLYKITTNSEGHVTAATAVVKADITGLGIPGDDTQVTNTLDTASKFYVTGTTTATTNTGTQTFDSGVYVTTTSGQLNASSYKLNEQVIMQWNATDESLDFVFA